MDTRTQDLERAIERSRRQEDERGAAVTTARDVHAADAWPSAGPPLAHAAGSPYTVRLPVFEGPLDLLLHLIERNQLEITAVSLVAVTDQFIAYLRTWDEPPLPRLAEFITMAARLLLIKSRSLLPRQPRQPHDEDDRDPLDD